MPNPPVAKSVTRGNTKARGSVKLNGEPYRQLDPKIIKMAEYLDRAIRSQDVTVGTVVSAVGVLLGRKVMDAQNLEHMARDVTMAMRIGFYLASASRKEGK